MAEYRLYCLSDVGGFTSAHEIAANTDEEAIQAAREMKIPVKCELWERGRKIAVLDPHLT